MKDQFAAWYPPSSKERQGFTTHGLVVLDTNVLLNLYRMTAKVREDVLTLFAQIGERLWIPHQVGLEFHRNRLSVIYEQDQADQKLRAAITEARDKLHAAVKAVRDHPVIDRERLATRVDSSINQITTHLDELRKEPTLSVKSAMHTDPVLDAVTDLLLGKVGDPYPADHTPKLLAEAKRRAEQRIPPGYADAKKDSDKSAGDYILWRQTLDEAAKRKLSVLFITNDQKDDWYRKLHGLTLGPRIELVAEMAGEAGVGFHAQTLARFIETAPIWLNATIQDSTVSEVNRLDELARATAEDLSSSRPTDINIDTLRTIQQFGNDLQRQPPPGTVEARTAAIVQLEVREQQLARRIEDLRLALANAKNVQDPQTTNDPRSYKRAIEARLEASSELLADTIEKIAILRSASG